MSKNTHRSLLIIILVLAVCATVLAVFAKRLPLFPGDLRLELALQSLTGPALTTVMTWTALIFTGWPAALMVFISGIILGWRRGWKVGLFAWGAGVLSYINDVFKLAINRPRPLPDQVHVYMINRWGINVNSGTGFPSGHSFFSLIFLGMLAFLLFTHFKNLRWRVLSLVLAVLLVLLVGTSRFYLGAHWPSDVLGGFIFGGLFWPLYPGL